MQTGPRKSKSHLGFTMIELLVVISIILIAASIIFLGTGGGDGAKLSSSLRIVSGLAQGARGQAILKNATVRLIIYAETNTSAAADPEKMLRYFGVIYRVQDDPVTGAARWVAANQGTYLPEGIYFNPELSAAQAGPWARANTMPLDFPRTQPLSGGSETYYFYEFSRNGTMATNPFDFQNAWLVLQAGTLRPASGGALRVDFLDEDKENLKAALIFRRAGTTTLVSEPGDITGITED